MNNDVSELRNLVTHYPERAETMKNQLFDYLEKVDAKYPQKDQQYDEAAEREHLKRAEERRMPQLENQRLQFLSPDFDPGNNWWGRKVD